MDIAVTPFPPSDDSAATQAFEILRESTEFDTPGLPSAGTLRTYLSGVRHTMPGRRIERALATVDGAAVGLVQLEFPELDNLGNINLEIHVRPGHRRRGIGRVLHTFAVDRARAAGRERLIAITAASPDVTTPGAAFAATTGAKAALAESRSRLDIGAQPLPDAPAAAGYRLVSWTGATPEELLDDIAYLLGRLNSDAPTGDLAWEDEKADADIIRQSDERAAQRGRTVCHTAAVHEASGRAVAWTTLVMQPDIAWHAWQSITIVDPEHRGHRLGPQVKIHNLGYVRSAHPQLRVIDTYNAAANAHMIRINEAMGFRRVDGWTQWQQSL